MSAIMSFSTVSGWVQAKCMAIFPPNECPNIYADGMFCWARYCFTHSEKVLILGFGTLRLRPWQGRSMACTVMPWVLYRRANVAQLSDNPSSPWSITSGTRLASGVALGVYIFECIMWSIRGVKVVVLYAIKKL